MTASKPRTDTLRHAIAAAAALIISMIMAASSANATTIAGTWSFEVDDWGITNLSVPATPVTGSATFTIESGTPANKLVLAGDFTGSFHPGSVSYDYSGGNPFDDTLVLLFGRAGYIIEADFINVSAHLVEPSVPPRLQFVLFRPSLTETLAARTFSGGFTPAPLPNTLPLFTAGLGGLGFVGWRRCERRRHAS